MRTVRSLKLSTTLQPGFTNEVSAVCCLPETFRSTAVPQFKETFGKSGTVGLEESEKTARRELHDAWPCSRRRQSEGCQPGVHGDQAGNARQPQAESDDETTNWVVFTALTLL